ncbi:hypothetical protein HAX54_027414, partial [Datura stramonium]|nr:hypothetical protein [Datura stramonium]
FPGLSHDEAHLIRLPTPNNTIKTLVGVMKDVLFKVEKFVLAIDFVVLDSVMWIEIFPSFLKTISATESLDDDKHEIMFRNVVESITFKLGASSIGVGDICVVNVEQEVGKVAEHAIAVSPKRKKTKLS